MTMNNMVGLVIGFIVIAIVAMVGLSVMEQTYDTTLGTVDNNTTLVNVHDDLGVAIETLSGFLPVVAIGVVGVFIIGLFLFSLGRGGTV